MPSHVEKITINIPVPDAADAYKQLAGLVACEALIEDGSRYVLFSIAGTRIAFVSGPEDLTQGRVALALQVRDTALVARAVKSIGLEAKVAEHPSPVSFKVVGLNGSADLLYYGK